MNFVTNIIGFISAFIVPCVCLFVAFSLSLSLSLSLSVCVCYHLFGE